MPHILWIKNIILKGLHKTVKSPWHKKVKTPRYIGITRRIQYKSIFLFEEKNDVSSSSFLGEHSQFLHHSAIRLVKSKLFLIALAGVAQWIERAGLRTKGSPVRFPVRAHAWVAGQVPSRGCVRGNHTMMFLSLSFSLPSPLKIFFFFKLSLINRNVI